MFQVQCSTDISATSSAAPFYTASDLWQSRVVHNDALLPQNMYAWSSLLVWRVWSGLFHLLIPSISWETLPGSLASGSQEIQQIPGPRNVPLAVARPIVAIKTPECRHTCVYTHRKMLWWRETSLGLYLTLSILTNHSFSLSLCITAHTVALQLSTVLYCSLRWLPC